MHYRLSDNPPPERRKVGAGEGKPRTLLVGVFHLEDGWACRLALEELGGAWEVSGVAVAPSRDLVDRDAEPSPSSAITRRLLRDLPLGGMAEELRRHVASHPTAQRRHPRWVGQLDQRPGRRGRPDTFYAEVAHAYLELVETGTGAPVQELAASWGYSGSQVNNWLHEARRRELLTAAPRGRAGGSLTPAAVELLASEAEEGQP
jgi:transposase-like protein